MDNQLNLLKGKRMDNQLNLFEQPGQQQPEGEFVHVERLVSRFTIRDFELGKVSVVQAPGFMEAMLEYLPWPTLQLECDYQPTHGRMTCVDEKTDFKYEVTLSC